MLAENGLNEKQRHSFANFEQRATLGSHGQRPRRLLARPPWQSDANRTDRG
jgi:hypothetical protein